MSATTYAPLYYQAVCNLGSTENDVTGQIFIREHKISKVLTVTGMVEGLSEGKHGFHVHADAASSSAGDSCTDAGAHYNPGDYDHGAPSSTISHAGDWGNIVAGADGVARVNAEFGSVSLDSVSGNIVGRSIVVHEDEDDLGDGDEDSLNTGNAGARLACCVIVKLDNSSLPAGARCDASKSQPGASRPTCEEGSCCGTALPAAGEPSFKVEKCYPTDTATVPVEVNAG